MKFGNMASSLTKDEYEAVLYDLEVDSELFFKIVWYVT